MPVRDRRYFSDEEKEKDPAYVVLVPAFLVSFLEAGNCLIPSLFYFEVNEYFTSSRTDVRVLFWLHLVQALSGLFLGPVITRCGVRRVTIFGSILASVCLVIPYFAPSFPVLVICIVVGIGIACGCQFMGSTCAVMQSFDRILSPAIAVQSMGFSLGIFVYPYVVPPLIAYYQWKGALLILGGVQLHGIVFGALFRPVKPKTDDREQGRRSIGGEVLKFIKDCFDVSLLTRGRLLLHFLSLTLVIFGESMWYSYLLNSDVLLFEEFWWKLRILGLLSNLSEISVKPVVFIYRYAKRNYKALIIAVASIITALLKVALKFAHSFPQILAAELFCVMLRAVYAVFHLSIIPDLSPPDKVPHFVGYAMFLIKVAPLLSSLVAAKWEISDEGALVVMLVSVMTFGGVLSLGTFYLHMRHLRRQAEAQSNAARNIEMDTL